MSNRSLSDVISYVGIGGVCALTSQDQLIGPPPVTLTVYGRDFFGGEAGWKRGNHFRSNLPERLKKQRKKILGERGNGQDRHQNGREASARSRSERETSANDTGQD